MLAECHQEWDVADERRHRCTHAEGDQCNGQGTANYRAHCGNQRKPCQAGLLPNTISPADSETIVDSKYEFYTDIELGSSGNLYIKNIFVNGNFVLRPKHDAFAIVDEHRAHREALAARRAMQNGAKLDMP